MPPPQWGGPQRSSIWGFSYIYAYTLFRRTTKFDMVTHSGGELVLGVHPRYHLKGAEPKRSPVLGFSSICDYTL